MYISQRVKTNKKFKFDEKDLDELTLQSRKKEIEEIKERYKKLNKDLGMEGVIIDQVGSSFGVRFDEEKEYLNTFEEYDETKRYLLVPEENLKTISRHSKKAELKMKLKYIGIKKIRSRKQSLRNSIKVFQGDIDRYLKNIEEMKDRAKNTKIEIKELDKQFKDDGDDKILDILKNKNIKEMAIKDDRLMILTKELPYNSRGIRYNQGNVVISMSLTHFDIHVFSNRYVFSGGGYYFNPCVDSSAGICYGSLRDEIGRLYQNGDFKGVINHTIVFLQHPNYQGPHIDANISKFCQKLPSLKLEEYDRNVIRNKVQSKWTQEEHNKIVEKFKQK